MNHQHMKRIAALSCLVLVACGGAGSIGGTISGLAQGAKVTLQNNGTDNLELTGTAATSFPFSFASDILAGSTYSATVLVQPAGQTCTVANGSGTINAIGESVTNIAVTCATTSSVTGTVSGLIAGTAVTLTSNGVALLAGNGSFAFPGLLPTGSAYSVTVTTQPARQTCTVTNGTGTVVANQAAVVTVSCV
ncbi:hypothetical protein BH09PSE5_BH09PSE5_44240 [soil metagenome]